MPVDQRKKRLREALEVQHRGKTYKGARVIEGVRKLNQYIIYGGRCLPDLHGYKASDKDTLMLSVAKMMLGELVSGRTLSAQSVEKFGL